MGDGGRQKQSSYWGDLSTPRELCALPHLISSLQPGVPSVLEQGPERGSYTATQVQMVRTLHACMPRPLPSPKACTGTSSLLHACSWPPVPPTRSCRNTLPPPLHYYGTTWGLPIHPCICLSKWQLIKPFHVPCQSELL